MLDTDASTGRDGFRAHHPLRDLEREPVAVSVDDSASNASVSTRALGTQLQALLAHPERHTVADFATLIERLLGELEMLRPTLAHATAVGIDPANATADAELQALFDATGDTAPLTAEAIDELASSLQSLNGETSNPAL